MTNKSELIDHATSVLEDVQSDYYPSLSDIEKALSGLIQAIKSQPEVTQEVATLPCDVEVFGGTFKKGVSLNLILKRADYHFERSIKSQPVLPDIYYKACLDIFDNYTRQEVERDCSLSVVKAWELGSKRPKGAMIADHTELCERLQGVKHAIIRHFPSEVDDYHLEPIDQAINILQGKGE